MPVSRLVFCLTCGHGPLQERFITVDRKVGKAGESFYKCNGLTTAQKNSHKRTQKIKRTGKKTSGSFFRFHKHLFKGELSSVTMASQDDPPVNAVAQAGIGPSQTLPSNRRRRPRLWPYKEEAPLAIHNPDVTAPCPVGSAQIGCARTTARKEIGQDSYSFERAARGKEEPPTESMGRSMLAEDALNGTIVAYWLLPDHLLH
ncbi:hypothetical protein BKA70DRAFT_1220351 [Coprinopsis sp. MPI-PUGE-AT-0042]|nr:hypothetical protein BKA70DRAFT_1220351 [Coprinopsis sp. MPI-PUGE-AT-0042]